MSFPELSRTLVTVFRRGVAERLSADLFNELALRAFKLQCETNPAYQGFVTRRGAEPSGVSSWEDIPPLPTRAFKSGILVSGRAEGVGRVFRTSGTTLGGARRGEHHVVDLGLYRESLLPNFKRHLLPDISDRIRILCLLPPPSVTKDSSLSFMMGEVLESEGAPGSGFFVTSSGELDLLPFRSALEASVADREPTLLAGTAFSFVQWTEVARRKGWGVVMPPGSRIMETGGYKGRSKELPRSEFYRSLQDLFGIPEGLIVNEYGMTELLSQFYEPHLSEGFGGASERGGGGPPLNDRFHEGPPWVRTRVLDPMTLDPVKPGEVGVLSHFDLANLGSVCGILTEDLGREVEGGFQLVGRTPGSEPRGCSLAMEDFLAAGRSG